jgi:hypothetical protein
VNVDGILVVFSEHEVRYLLGGGVKRLALASSLRLESIEMALLGLWGDLSLIKNGVEG